MGVAKLQLAAKITAKINAIGSTLSEVDKLIARGVNKTAVALFDKILVMFFH